MGGGGRIRLMQNELGSWGGGGRIRLMQNELGSWGENQTHAEWVSSVTGVGCVLGSVSCRMG